MSSSSASSKNIWQSNDGQVVPCPVKQVNAITSATTMTMADSGKINVVTVPSSAGYTVGLPAPSLQPGAELDFVIGTAGVYDVTFTPSTASSLYGLGIVNQSGVTGCNANRWVGASSIIAKGSTGATGACVVGDRVKFLSDGTRWLVDLKSLYTNADLTFEGWA
jgi:hypothetical protein